VRDDSDESLMLRYRDGDVRAFELLVTRHRKPLFNFILRFVRDTAQAEDVTQETFLRLVKGADAYERQAKFTTWLYTIAHHRLIDHWRVKGLAVVPLDTGDDDEGPALDPAAGPEADPHEIAVAVQTRDRFAAALAALPLVQREAFLLHAEGGLTVPEIAAATATNEEAAKSRLRYAMKKLREAIEDE